MLYLLSLAAAIGVLFFGPELPVKPPQAAAKKKQPFALFQSSKEAIGIVRLDGLISMERRGGFSGGNMVDRVKKNLERFAKKKQVKAIILRINSPGGTVASSQAIYRSIGEIRRKYKKPIIALMGDVAASGGYYVASACDRIVAEPGTITGSIGVIFQTGDFHNLIKRFGIKFNTIKSGPYKDIGNPFRPMTKKEKRILQNMIDTAYDQFVQAVAQGRKMSPLDVRKIADGRIWLGEQAQRMKMIDNDAGMSGAINIAKDLGKIKGEPKLLWDWDIGKDFLTELLNINTKANFLPPSGLLYLWTGY